MIPDHRIENNEEFSHTCGHDDSVRFAVLFETFGELTYRRVYSAGIEGGHVEGSTYVFSASCDVHLAIMFSGGAVPGRYADKCGDLLPIDTAEFGESGDEHCAGVWAYAGGTLDDAVFVGEVVIGFDIVSNEFVDLFDLEVEGPDHFSDALFDLGVVNHLHTIGLLGVEIVELATPSDQLGQFGGLGRCVCFGAGFDDLCELREDVCVDGIGLCVLAHSFCEVSDLPWIYDDDGQGCGEQFCGERTFVSAGGFDDDQGGVVLAEQATEFAMIRGCVGHVFGDELRRSGDTEGVFCDVDSYIDLFGHGKLPYLQMRTRRACGRATVQTAVRADAMTTTRFPLGDGLLDQGTIELSPPAGVGSLRCAFAGAALRSPSRHPRPQCLCNHY